MSEAETNFGPYRIEEEVGRGGMATVYRAYQPSMNREVAIKLLPRKLLHDDTFLARFQREIELAAAISHPHILPIYDFGEYDEQPFIAMRYMARGSLGDYVAESPLTLDEAVRIMEQTAEALDYLHSKGIIHRDLKVDNILLDEAGNAYLTDFGVARLEESQTMLTGSRVVGTPSHMAPEMFQQGTPTPQVDIYALGVMLYHMLTGHLPFDADTPMAYMERHLFTPVPGLRAYRTDLPNEVDEVIEQAMAKDPADRYATAAELVRDLKRAAQPVRRRLPLLLGVGVAVIAAGVVGVLALTGQFSAGPNSIADALPTETATSTQLPTQTALPTTTSTVTLEPTPTATSEPAIPPPVVGGGTGLIAFNRNNQTYLIDASCVVAEGVNCNPNPQIIPAIGGINIALLSSNGTGGGNGFLDTGLQLWSANGQYLGIAARVLGPTSAIYAADITCIESGTCDAGLITFPFDTSQGAVSWAPNGVRFAVNSDYEGYDDSLTIADVACLRDGGEDCIRRVIQETGGISNIVWSHDGNKIAYRTNSWFSLSVDGGLLNRTDLTAWATNAQYLHWMPGDEQIVYVDQTSLTDIPGSPESKFSLMMGPTDGTPASFLTTLFEGNIIFGDVSYLPAAMLSPDGTRVAIAAQDENFDYRDLYILDLACLDQRDEDFLACERPPFRATDTPYVTQITGGPADVTAFSWSPDGQWIAFVRSVETTFVTSSDDTRNNGAGDLYVVNVDEALTTAPEEAVVRLTRLGTVNYAAPQWQPATD